MFKNGGRAADHNAISRLPSSDGAPFLHLWKIHRFASLGALKYLTVFCQLSHVIDTRCKITFLDAFS